MLGDITSEHETPATHDLCQASSCLKNTEMAQNETISYNETWQNQEMLCVIQSDSEDFLSSVTFQTLVYVMYSTVFVVALLGNGLVCFVVHSSPRMKTVTNYFIVNLAVGDILMTLFCVPFSFVSMLVLRYWPFGAVMCKVVNYTQAVSVLVSAYTLQAISLDRYMAVMRPLKPRLEKASAKLVVAGVWCGALATAGPIPIVSRLQRPSPWHEACKLDICSEQWTSAAQSSQYTCALLALQFVLPLSALVLTYTRIARAVWGGRPPGEAESARDSRMQKSKIKMIKMMVTVVAVFTISWLPLNVFIVLWTTHEDDITWAQWPGMPYVWFASHWLAMSHSCYNPIIYCYMNVRYRRGFKQVISRLLCLKSSGDSRTLGNRYSNGIPMSAVGRPLLDIGLPQGSPTRSVLRRPHPVEMVGINGSTGARRSCKCRVGRLNDVGLANTLPSNASGKCTNCSSMRKVIEPGVQRPLPARALSIRSHFT